MFSTVGPGNTRWDTVAISMSVAEDSIKNKRAGSMTQWRSGCTVNYPDATQKDSTCKITDPKIWIRMLCNTQSDLFKSDTNVRY